MRMSVISVKAILAGVLLSGIGGCTNTASSGPSDAGAGRPDATPNADASAANNDASTATNDARAADNDASAANNDASATNDSSSDSGSAATSNDGGTIPALTAGQVYCVVSYSNASGDFNGPVDTWSSDVVSNFGAPSVANAGAGHDTISIVANSFAGGFARDGKQRGFDVFTGAGVGTVGTPVNGKCNNVYYAPTAPAVSLYTWIADKSTAPTSSCTVTFTGVQGTVYTYDILANLVPDAAGLGVVPGVGTATAHATCTADLP